MSPRALSIAPLSSQLPAGATSDFARFYRWGWLPLVGGTFAICGGALLVADLAIRTSGAAVSHELRLWSVAGAFLLSALITGWSGYFVHRARSRIEHAREDLLVERAALSEQRRRFEQAEGVAAILRVMAHEIRTPLHGIRLHASVIRKALTRGAADVAAESLTELDDEIQRLARLVDEYVERGGAAPVAIELQRIDVREPVREAVEAHRSGLHRVGIGVELELPSEAMSVEAEPRRLGEIVHRLLRNAAEAQQPGGRILVRVRRDPAKPRAATIEVEDCGPGFENPSVAFRPFYSTKPDGTGLGLSIVHDVVRAHRGEVCAFNHERGGACVRIRLPLIEESCSA